MDRMIILIVLYLVICYLINRIKISDKYKRWYSLIMIISFIVVIFGFLTPFNYVYTFLFAYALLFVNFVLAKFIFKDSKNKEKINA